MARTWRWGGGRHSDQIFVSKQVKALGKYLPHSIWVREMCLSVVAVSPSWKMASSVLSKPTVFRHSQLVYFVKKILFWPFKMGKIVQSNFISLWCVCFASAEAGCHICHVCSGFYSLLLITAYRPHERAGICKHDLQVHSHVAHLSALGFLFSWQSFLCLV